MRRPTRTRLARHARRAPARGAAARRRAHRARPRAARPAHRRPARRSRGRRGALGRASARDSGGLNTDDKTLATLEFPAVLARAASHAAFSVGRERVLALRPTSDRELAARRQRETGEAVHLERLGVDLSLGGAHDVRAHARGAERGHVLTVAELLEIAGTARAGDRLRRAFARLQAVAPLLATTAADLADLGALRARIEQAIDERGEVADRASPALAAIRREAAAAHDRLQQRIQSLLRSVELRQALQEPLVTLRDGRHVVPVRAEARAAVSGVVHDTSASGATVYVEPLAIVELGNAWRELQLQERHEIERILRDLAAAVGAQANALADCVERLGAIDCALARARYARAIGAEALASRSLEQPWLVTAPAELRLKAARHPLLGGTVVPVSLTVGGDTRALLITGPNTGGKTVALKTAGLLCLMALAGLPVPAETGTQVPAYDAVFADIGDEQSITQSLSTFSGHMSAVIDILERATARSLVLLDELGAGTDPTEGAALAIAIVERLRTGGATLVATTHHSELKLYAHRTEGVRNASVEFDLNTLSPTFRLTMGLPGQSNALAVAARLGLPADVVAAARAGLSREQRELETVLAELRAQLTGAQAQAEQAAHDAAAARVLRAELEQRSAALAAETEALRAEAREAVHDELRDT
ncbi:MAG: endonuclease MutS2, partial [Chloroflexi bacterium]|nr:endonuclease MutS2 [Chloroflexota bacterium]